MALIRALSNPEGLYIFGSVDDRYEITTGNGWELSNIGPGQGTMVIPGPVFEAVAQKWLDDSWNDEPIEIDGFRVETDVHVFMDTGEPVPEDWGVRDWLRQYNEGKKTRKVFWGIKLSYKEHYTYLYRVSWYYSICRYDGLWGRKDPVIFERSELQSLIERWSEISKKTAKVVGASAHIDCARELEALIKKATGEDLLEEDDD